MTELTSVQTVELQFPFIVYQPFYSDLGVFEQFLMTLFGEIVMNDLPDDFRPDDYACKSGSFTLFSRGRIRPTDAEIRAAKVYEFAI